MACTDSNLNGYSNFSCSMKPNASTTAEAQQTSPGRKITTSPADIIVQVDSPWLNRKKAIVRRCCGKTPNLRSPKRAAKSKPVGELKGSGPVGPVQNVSRWGSEPSLEGDGQSSEAAPNERWESSPRLSTANRSPHGNTRCRVPTSPSARSPKLPKRQISRNTEEKDASPRMPSLKVHNDCAQGLENLKKRVQGRLTP